MTVKAQQFVFSSYSLEQGLSQSVVNCIFQDSKGFIWVGTQNGINRFNGYDFEVFTYNPNDSNTISNNWILCMDEDSAGNLWIGTKGGLNEYIRSEKRFRRITYSTPYQFDVTAYIYDVVCETGGNILINTPPVLSIYNPGKNKFSHHVSKLIYDGAVKDNPIPLLRDHKGLIWMGSTRGLACFNPANESFEYFLRRNIDGSPIYGIINDLVEDRQANLWIASSVGLDMIRRGGGPMANYFEQEKSNSLFSGVNIRTLLLDNDGNLWIGTEGRGLYKISTKAGSGMITERFTAADNGLNHNIILSLALDQSDNLWVGTLSGINKTDLKKPRFRLYRNSLSPNSTNLLGNVIASLYKDKEGSIWIGNWGQGLNYYDRKNGTFRHYSSEMKGNQYIPNDYVHVIYGDDKNRMWIGTRDGLLIYDPVKKGFLRPGDFFNDKRIAYFRGMRIFKIIQDKSLDYWIATQNGLFRMNHSDFSTIRFYKEAVPGLRLSGNLVYSLVEDREGFIWIATLEGLDVWNPKTSTLKHFRKVPGQANSLCDNFVTALCEDHEGNIWIGTNSYLNKFVKKDSAFVYYSKADGLPNNLIYSILEDNSQNIWVATGNGLARFDSDRGKFRVYSVKDGLQSPEFNLGTAFRSSDGELFFGGMNGFNSFYPDSLGNNPHLPPIAITAFYKTSKGEKVYLDPATPNEVVLRYNEYPITIEFAALEFTNPEENHYAYKLEGIDKDWIDIGNRRFVAFSNLPPGIYTFRVKCANNDGKWNETGESLQIRIRPPWWRSSTAFVIYLVLFAASLVFYIKMRERRHIRERKILEENVRQRTLQIESQKKEILEINEELRALNSSKDKFFSIIAHDLRNPFNAIIGLTDILLGNISNTDVDKLQRTLTNIKNSSAQAHELLENLLVWARNQTGGLQFNPQQINVKQMVEENIALAESQAARKNILLSATIKHSCILSGDENMINSIIRNLLTNAIKFTPQNGKVSVVLAEENGDCALNVSDNGIGIAPERLDTLFSIETKHKTKGTDQEPGTGLGLILCKEFVLKHGGRIEVTSKTGEGSVFRVLLPVKLPFPP